MFNLSAFAPNQNSSHRSTPTKPLQNGSPSFNPLVQPGQLNWDNPTYQSPGPNENQKHEEIPYNIRVLLENEQEISSTSSDSEETDTMPEVTPKMHSNLNDWDFGRGEIGRRKSEIVSASNPLLQAAVNNYYEQSNPRSWIPPTSGKVNVKPTFFGPLNLADFNQDNKKAYFVTIEGFNQATSKRIFKIERLCHALQKQSKNGNQEGKQFLHLSLWNNLQNGQQENDNIFEPWIYAVPNLQFRLVAKIYMTHAYEDPYVFDFALDLLQFALPIKDRRTQSLEVSYVEQHSSSPGMVNATNNVTLHVQVTNEKLLVPHGFRNIQDQRQNEKSDYSLDYSVIFRQIFVALPLKKSESPFPAISPLLQHHTHRLNGVYGKRGSAIYFPQPKLLDQPQSPMSWSNFSGNSSPAADRFSPQKQQTTQMDPVMPPGLPNNNSGSPHDTKNYVSGNSLFKFNHNNNHQRQQRFSIQPVKRDPEEVPVFPKRTNRIQSSDLSSMLEGDKSPLKVLEAYVQAFAHRKESSTSESTSGTNYSMVSRFQANLNEPDSINQGGSEGSDTINMNENGKGEADLLDGFRIEDYVGKIVEYAQSFQGSKVLQKYVSTAPKDDLDVVFKEIGEKIGELMLDPYANYMIQTLVQCGYPRQRLYLFQKLAPYFNFIARDKKGTHSLQAIVAQVDSVEEFGLLRNTVGPYVFELSMEPRANYVIQKLINIIPPDHSSFLYQPLFDNFVQVANNSFGLLVLKQMMARVEPKEALKLRVVELTCLNFEKLIQNPYGNYAIQHIIEYYPRDSLMIMNKILAKIIPYSSQKISSNVIEKCLMACDSQFRRKIVDEILKNGRLGDLMKNKYGNFVTLQLLATSSPTDKQLLMQEIFRCANSFNGTKYKTRWLKFIQENPMKIDWNSNMVLKLDEINQEQDLANGFEDNNTKHFDEGKLETVKKIWREMTKEEKSDASPFHGSNTKMPMGKKHYQK